MGMKENIFKNFKVIKLDSNRIDKIEINQNK